MSYAPIGYLGQVPAAFDSAYALLSSTVANMLLVPQVQAMMSRPFDARQWKSARNKVHAGDSRDLSDAEVRALIVGSLAQAKVDLVKAKLFKMSPAASDARAAAAFRNMMAADVQILRQLPRVVEATNYGSAPSTTKTGGKSSGVAGLGLIFDPAMISIVAQSLSLWYQAQEARERWLREQIALCEELASRGTPCQPETLASYRAELEEIESSPLRTAIEETAGGLRAVPDGIREGISATVKTVLIPIAVVTGVVMVWAAWPLLSSLAKGARRAAERRAS